MCFLVRMVSYYLVFRGKVSNGGVNGGDDICVFVVYVVVLDYF